jgi:hypothetical protein
VTSTAQARDQRRSSSRCVTCVTCVTRVDVSCVWVFHVCVCVLRVNTVASVCSGQPWPRLFPCMPRRAHTPQPCHQINPTPALSLRYTVTITHTNRSPTRCIQCTRRSSSPTSRQRSSRSTTPSTPSQVETTDGQCWVCWWGGDVVCVLLLVGACCVLRIRRRVSMSSCYGRLSDER